MRHLVTRLLVVLVLFALCTACGSDAEQLIELVLPDISGTWSYTAQSMDQTLLRDCSGDVGELEGLTLTQASTQVPICLMQGTFTVQQNGASFAVDVFGTTCSNGFDGEVTGSGTLAGSVAIGEWHSQSDDGIDVIRDFSGAVSELGVALVETELTFGGAIQGSCSLEPPLAATATIL